MHVHVCVEVSDSLHGLLLEPWMKSMGNYVFGFVTQTHKASTFAVVVRIEKAAKEIKSETTLVFCLFTLSVVVLIYAF